MCHPLVNVSTIAAVLGRCLIFSIRIFKKIINLSVKTLSLSDLFKQAFVV